MFFFIASCIVVILYFILIFPRVPNKTRKFSFERFYAHRGLFENGTLCPENSLASFMRAVEAGYGIELDVHVTKDNQVVVFHDDNLVRMCGDNIKIEECTYEELSRYRLLETDERIPLLSDVLKVVANRVPLIIEIKALNNVNHRCKIITTEIEKSNCRYCIESFNPLVLKWYKKNRPLVIRGQLSTDYCKDKVGGNVFRNFALTNLLFNFLSRPDFIAYNHIYCKSLSFLITTKMMGALPVAWTIRSQKEMDVAKSSFHVFIFEGFVPSDAPKPDDAGPLGVRPH